MVQGRQRRFLVVMVNSAGTYTQRRTAIRRSWLRYIDRAEPSPLSAEQIAR
jgi:hypothetical protein